MKTNSKTVSVLILAVLVVGAAAFAYYYVIPKPNPAVQNSVTTTLPVVSVSSGKFVAGFPDFPIFPNANIVSSQITQAVPAPNPEPPSYQAYLESDKSVAEIISWYTTDLKTAGWVMVTPADPSTPTDESIVITNDGLTASVNVEKMEKSRISIDVRQSK